MLYEWVFIALLEYFERVLCLNSPPPEAKLQVDRSFSTAPFRLGFGDVSKKSRQKVKLTKSLCIQLF